MRGRDFFARKAGRRDANHAAIRDGLRRLGHFVIDCGGVGGGVPDLCVFPFGRTTLGAVWLELKVARGKLRQSQLDWRAQAEARGLVVRVARTFDEALDALAE